MTTASKEQGGPPAKVAANSVSDRRSAFSVQSLLNTANAPQRPVTVAPAPPPVAAANWEVVDDRDLDGSVMTLPTSAVELYEHNPRYTKNPNYEQIKRSIRQIGITQTILVTRRPGQRHYICAAGGNTRLAIQKELLAETGLPQFAEITVKFRAWRSEAAVLIAHLGENFNKGDTVYWDDVRGLIHARDELERELGQKLSSAELHAKLEADGTDLGLRDIKYKLFAYDFLNPLGVLLNATAVKALQPAYGGLQGLAEPFGVSREVEGALQDALTTYVLMLSHRSQQSVEEVQPELQIDEVTESLCEGFGKLINSGAAQVSLMLVARASNPRIGADELRSPKLAPAPRRAKERAADADDASPQMPLSGPAILAGVRAARPPSPSATPANPAPGAEADLQLPPVGSEHVVHSSLATTTNGDPQAKVTDLLKHFAIATELHDVVVISEGMPLGFYLELPEAGIDSIDGRTPADPALRRASWVFLAGLSGQFDATLLTLLPDTSEWRQLALSGHEALSTRLDLLLGIKPSHDGDLQLSVAELYRLFWHPRVGALVAELWHWAMDWRDHEPGRFPPPTLTERLVLV